MEAQQLLAELSGLGPYEKIVAMRIMRRVCQRLRLGRERYGEYTPARRGRNWRNEMREEGYDLMIYSEFDSYEEEFNREDGGGFDWG